LLFSNFNNSKFETFLVVFSLVKAANAAVKVAGKNAVVVGATAGIGN
jgi:hypothetical protein